MENITEQISANRLTRIAVVLASLGIACGQQPSPKGVKQFHIVDPMIEMTALSGTVPANWSFDGMLLVGPPCNNFNTLPPPIWRTVSPDGITAVRQLAPIPWAWGGDGTAAKVDGCFPIARALTAYEFSHQYLLGILGVTFVRDVPGPPQQNRWSAPTGQPPIAKIYNEANMIVSYKIKGVAVEERVLTTVLCNDTFLFLPRPNGTHLYSCIANVGRFTARQGNLKASEELFKSVSARYNPQWFQHRMQIVVDDLKRKGAEGMRRLKALQDQGAAVTNRIHADFMAQSQRSGDTMRKNFNDNMARQSRMADDWCDYALDLQKRQSPIDGSVIKTSSQYSYTWVNEFGEVINSNDANYNPNGQRKGNWTLQTNIR